MRCDMQLGIRAPMCSLTGYAEFGREMVMALEKEGVEIFLQLLDHSMYEASRSSLPQQVIDVITRLQQDIPPHIPVLTIGTPPQYATDLGSMKIGIGLFEAFSVPRPWLTVMNRMDLILTLSEFNREVFARHGISRRKIEVIPPAVDSDRFHPTVRPFYVGAVHPFTILFVGQLILRKGWDKLLLAALRTFRTHEDVCVVVKVPPVRNRGEHLRVAERLRVVKREAGGSKVPVYCNDLPVPVEQVPRVYQVPRKKLPGRIYRHLNGEPPKGIFALPSLGEGIGLPYLEAQASGLLALGTRSTGQEFLNPSNAVIVNTGPPVRNIQLELESTLYRGAPFPSVTVEAVADALQRAYSMSPMERTKIENTARSQVAQLSYTNCVRRVLSLIGERL